MIIGQREPSRRYGVADELVERGRAVDRLRRADVPDRGADRLEERRGISGAADDERHRSERHLRERHEHFVARRRGRGDRAAATPTTPTISTWSGVPENRNVSVSPIGSSSSAQ